MEILTSIKEKFLSKISLIALFAVLLGLVSCATTDDALKKDVETLRQDMAELNRRLSNADVQIEELNNNLLIMQDRLEKVSSGGISTVPKEPLKVVKLVPKEETPPVIVLTPDGGQKKEQALYDEALAKFRQASYDEALSLFLKYREMYQTGDLTDNAIYWSGRVYMEKGEYQKAISTFRQVFDFPETNKGADALLQIALAYEKIGNQVYALDTWQQILYTFPGTEAAEAANRRLSEMKEIPQQ